MPLPSHEAVRFGQTEVTAPAGKADHGGDTAHVQPVVVKDRDDMCVLQARRQSGLFRQLPHGSRRCGFACFDPAAVRNSSPVSEPLLSQWIRFRDRQGIRR